MARETWIELGPEEWAIAVMAAKQALRIERAKGASGDRECEVIEKVLTLCTGEVRGDKTSGPYVEAFEKVAHPHPIPKSGGFTPRERVTDPKL